MPNIEALLSYFNGLVWGPPMLALLLGTHIFLTLRLKFVQRHVGKGIRLSVSKKDEKARGDVSPMGSLMTALAATIGTGNIIGVATAVSIGGPGAVFWLWITGLFGMATKYSEALLSVKYRTVSKTGEMAGGPMYVLERGLKMKWLAVIFAVLTSIAAFGIGCTVQANSIACLMKDTFAVDHSVTGAVLAVLAAAVILGGIKSIAKVCSFLVPFMAIFYISGCLVILAVGIASIPATIWLIITSAFTTHGMIGGFAGASWLMAMRYGVARGLFSNESGMGSAPIAAAASRARNPVRQALVSSTGTFWDTVVVCLITGLVLVNTGVWQKGLAAPLLTSAAFGSVHGIGPVVLTVALLTFVYSTLIGWSYYGEKAIEYLGGHKLIFPYRALWCIMVYFGSVFSLSFVWDAADIANGLMALPNLVSLLLLSGIIVKETRYYLWENRLDEEGS